MIPYLLFDGYWYHRMSIVNIEAIFILKNDIIFILSIEIAFLKVWNNIQQILNIGLLVCSPQKTKTSLR